MKHAAWHEMCYGISSLYSFVPGLGSLALQAVVSLLSELSEDDLALYEKLHERWPPLPFSHRDSHVVHTLLLLLHHSRSPRPLALLPPLQSPLSARAFSPLAAAQHRCVHEVPPGTAYRTGQP